MSTTEKAPRQRSIEIGTRPPLAINLAITTTFSRRLLCFAL